MIAPGVGDGAQNYYVTRVTTIISCATALRASCLYGKDLQSDHNQYTGTNKISLKRLKKKYWQKNCSCLQIVMKDILIG